MSKMRRLKSQLADTIAERDRLNLELVSPFACDMLSDLFPEAQAISLDDISSPVPVRSAQRDLRSPREGPRRP